MENSFNKPVRLKTSRAWRTYLGGAMISALHGEVGEDGHFPEEWLMSTVTARNAGREHIVEGECVISDTGMPFKDFLASDPDTLLGTEHASRHGANPGVLVKLLDSAERLTLQVHPTKAAARTLFNSEYGKTECWHIIGTRTVNGESPCIYVGFKEGVTREEWKRCFDEQDIPAMLACLHRIEVKVGDTFIIRGGVPHGIGAGCFLVEIQEPTDYTVRTERVTPSGLAVADSMCHQGLGFERMLDCFEYDGASVADTLAKYRVEPILTECGNNRVENIIYPEVTDLFALDKVTVNDSLALKADGRFYSLYVLEGSGALNGAPFNKCDHYFIPASLGDLTVENKGDTPLVFVRCYGPTA